MANEAEAIGALIGRFTNKVVTPQAKMEFEAWDKGVIKEKKKPTERGVVNLKNGGLSSTKLLADGGTLPTGDTKTITQATYDPAIFLSRLEMPRGGVTISNNPSDGVDLLKENMETVGRDLGQLLGRSFFETELANSATNVTSGAVYTAPSAAGYVIGMTVQQYNGSTLVQSFTVTDITLDADGDNGAVITTDADFSSTNLTAAHTLHVQGAKDTTFVSYSQLADTSTTVYGIARDLGGLEGQRRLDDHDPHS